MHNLNRRGFTLLELVISLGIAAVMLFSVQSLMTFAWRAIQTGETLNSELAMEQEIGVRLSNQDSCTTILQGLNSVVGATTSIPLANFAGINLQPYDQFISVQSASIKDISIATGSIYQAHIEIQGQKSGKNLGMSLFSHDFFVFYSVGPGNVIVNCNSNRVLPSIACVSTDGIWNAATSTCNYCTSLGGTMKSGVCVIP